MHAKTSDALPARSIAFASWQPRSAVEALAQRNGWQIDHLKIDDGCYEIKGRDSEGFRIKVKLDPATLDVVKMKREREKRGQLLSRKIGLFEEMLHGSVRV